SISPLHFDFSLLDLGVAFLNAPVLAQVPRVLAHHPRALIDYLNEQRISQMHSVPSVWRPTLANYHCDPVSELPYLDTVVYGAEGFTAAEVQTVQQWMPKVRVVQAFGHTESIGCCYKELSRPPQAFDGRVSLGSAFTETEMFVLGDDGCTPDSGQVGELHVKGPHLFSGYWRDPNLTEERLIPDPRTSENNDLVFRSGDLVLRDEVGEFYFVGRKDFQVKVGGNRVEPEEIELVLSRDPAVSRVHVVPATTRSRTTLVCFVVLHRQIEEFAFSARLRKRAAEALPRYMVPRCFKQLDDLPLLSNGKVDRAKLGLWANQIANSE